MTPQKLRLLPLLASILVSGCAIQPSSLSDAELAQVGSARAQAVTANQEPVSGPIDLHQAMARGLLYNLDHRVETMQTALRMSELNLAHYQLLPNLVGNSGYASRNNDLASSSLNLVTGVPNFGSSTSQERHLRTADLAFSWHVLDFGLSYVRARQAADKALIAEEMRRKAAHRIVEDIRTAFWRAISAEHLIRRLEKLKARTAEAKRHARAVSNDQETSQITGLTHVRELVEIERTLKELGRDLATARMQLAALMNLKPGTKFSLVQPSKRDAPQLGKSTAEMIKAALEQRPEMRENLYQKRINEQELNAAYLELLPGIQLFAGSNYDSNAFLLNSNWLGWGAKASWNLIKVFQAPAKREVVNAQDALLDERGLALTMAIMTQVHVSKVRYHHLTDELKTAEEYRAVQASLAGRVSVEVAAGRVSEQTLLREELGALVAEAKRDIAYAAVQNAYANCLAAMGVDAVGAMQGTGVSVSDLASQLRGGANANSPVRVSLAKPGDGAR
jgi:outer membrane protein TolC